MSYDEYNLLESVIHMTEERDKKSLIKVLIEILSDFIDFDALILLSIPYGANSEYLEAIASIPKNAYQDKLKQIPHEYGNQRVQQDDSTTLCIDNREIISEEVNGTNRMLVPIVINNVVTDILDIYGHHRTTSTEKLICGFIRIYSNFLAIIHDNEHDTLTGLLNRKTFDTRLSELSSVADAQNDTSSFIERERRTAKDAAYHWAGILDLDFFKGINDTFGHVYGDEVLLLFADLMKKTFRNDDLLFRYGGEEFVVVLAPVTELDAFIVFERFRRKVESFIFPQVKQVTVSIGIVNINTREHSATVLEHADKALYYAKEHGRNQTCNYRELIRVGAMKAPNLESDIEIFTP